MAVRVGGVGVGGPWGWAQSSCTALNLDLRLPRYVLSHSSTDMAKKGGTGTAIPVLNLVLNLVSMGRGWLPVDLQVN
eukprot:SAG31_NODE_661_length_13035_cov_12.057591_17_plen_77_part_00